ncbi:MAG: hypothetical protein GY894_01580 [Planctomycetes bacterium]|nr:hypothetical protein [Planctomycetota bacterium]
MSTATRRKAPVMYHRRLRLIAAAVCVVTLALLVQAVRLTLVQGAGHRAVAESRLQQRTWLPTWRGSILDRDGDVLVRDEPRWEVRVAFDAITGQWAEDRAVRAARRAMGRDAWSMASPEVRAGAIAAARQPWDAILESLWAEVAATAHVSREELNSELNEIRGSVQRMAAVVWEQQRRRHEARFGASGGPDFVPRPIREQAQSHVIIPDLLDAPASGLEAFAAEHPDLVDLNYSRVRGRATDGYSVDIDLQTLPGPLRNAGFRSVPLPAVADAIVGDVRTGVWEEDVARRPFKDAQSGTIDRGGYRVDDVVGTRGIERAFEDRLRGEVGLVIRNRDEGEQTREQPIGGGDVALTIDTLLQARIEAILDPSVGLTRVQPYHSNDALPVGTELPASVVVLDIDSGEILAMASTPFPATLNGISPAAAAALQPWLIRGVQVVAPPGSIVKPLVLAAALTEGVIEPDSILTCNGHHFENSPGIARCWIYRPKYGMATHGPLGAVEAVARSCNSWFYELGDRLGAGRLSDWLGSFGLGEPLDIGLTPEWADSPVEVAGPRPSLEEIAALEQAGEATFESIMLAIGQGRSTWTPLHAADAYATLARHGRRVPPTIVKGYVPVHRPAGRPIAPSVAALAIDGLEDVVAKSWGTANHLNLPTGREPVFRVGGVRIAAKTGTAQAPPWKRDVDGSGVIERGERVTGLEHSWVVTLLGDEGESWRYALAVLVEYGGSGGRVAGPIADQVIRAMQAEGLLGGGAP